MSLARGTDARPPPCPGAFPSEPAEQAGQVRLIRESAVQRNLAQGSIGRQHEPLGTLDATTDHVLVRWLTEAVPERATEVRRVQSHQRGELFVLDRPIQVRL